MNQIEGASKLAGRRLEEALDAARIGMCLIDEDLRYTWANETFAKMLRYPMEDLIGRTVLELSHPDDVNLHREFAGMVLRGELDHFTIRKRFIASDGSIVACDVLASGAFDVDGVPIVGLGIQTNANRADPTSQRIETLQRSAAIGQLTASAVHDLRNSLSSISLANASAVARFGSARELQIIENEVGTALSLLTTMAGFANPNQPSSADRSDPMSVRSVVDQTYALLRLVTPAGTGLTVNAEAEAIADIDARSLQQVLVNLTLNARDASGSEISITAARSVDEAGCVDITVADNGSGMTSDDLARAFEPYFTTKGSGGTGLGLAICKEIIERQRGSLTLDSVLGRGTTANVRLPVFQSQLGMNNRSE